MKVVGPESRVRQLADATTEPVNIAGSRERVRDVVTVGVADAAVRLDSADRATVIVEILPAPVERELTGVPVRWRNLGARDAGAGGAVGRQGQRPRAAGGARRRCAPTGSRPSWTLPGSAAGRYNLRVQVDPAEHFGLDTITPSVVQVTIR